MMDKKLSEMGYDEKGTVLHIDRDLRQQIAGMGIREGKTVKMLTKQPIKGPVVITVDRNKTSIGLGLAEKIVVQVAE